MDPFRQPRRRMFVTQPGTQQRVRREERNELSSMSSQSVDSGQILANLTSRRRRARQPTRNAEVVVKGRNVEIPDHFRIYVSQKLARLERFDRTIYLFDVELDHERNRRQRKILSARRDHRPRPRAGGPGEACADSFYAALESAVAKLESRLRRVKDRRKVHYGDKTPGVAGRSHRGAATERPTDASARRPSAEHDGAAIADHEPGPDRAHQGAPGQADDGRRRALRDGARRARLLPVPRQGDRTAVAWSTGGTPTTTG